LQGLLGSRARLQNRYEVVSLLGCGGMGAVYLALDHRLGQNQVAVKENFDTSPQAQAQFRREANVLARLSHSNLPKVIDHFIEPSGRQYLVMEYVSGSDLDTLVQQRGALPEGQVLTWADALLDALSYLHGQPQPVIHRDIKPSNIKITPDGKVKLVDFGLVKFFDPANPRTSTSMRGLGTPQYAPPEQYNATGFTDNRSDVYSLGATLYHLLTGQAPATATMRMANPAVLRPPRQIMPNIKPSTETAILRAIELPMNNRFQSAVEMRQALRGLAPAPQVAPRGTSPVMPPPPQPIPSTPSPAPLASAKKTPWLWLGVGAAIVLIVSGVSILALGKLFANATATPPAVVSTRGAAAIAAATVTPTSKSVAGSATPAPTDKAATGTVIATTPPAATSAPTPTPPPSPTLLPGALSGLQVSTDASGKTGLRIEIKYADGLPKTGSWAAVLAQKTDVSGNPVFGDRLNDGRTDATGTIFFKLDPGTYAVQLGDLVGVGWGPSFNYVVSSGSTTVLSLTLARLVIGLRNAEGGPLQSRWTGISLQKPDVSGNPVRGDRVADARTDNTGAIVYNLVPGTYAVDIGDIAGETWGEPMNHALPAGQTTNLVVTLGRLTIGIKNADGKPKQGHWVGVSYQKLDVSGNPVRGDRFLDGRTDNTGAITWDVTAGTYVVEIGDIYGAAWGDPMNRVVKSGENTLIVLTLGRLTVGLKDASGNPLQGKWIGLYMQKKDVAGNIVKGDRFLDGRTDNTGIVSWDVTAGRYIVEIQDGKTFMDVSVQSGQTTFTDGVSVTTK
jgi:serine/threonine-protein kinase